MTNLEKIKSKTLDEIKNAIKISTSLNKLLNNLGVTNRDQNCKNYLKQIIIDNKIDSKHLIGKNALINNITKEELQRLVELSDSWSDIIKGMGRTFHGSFIKSLKNLVIYYNIDVSHFDYRKILIKNNAMTKNENEIFCENSLVARGTVKNRILKNKMLPYICNDCKNIGDWNGKKLSLQLEHINGIRNDHRLENLCFLCPNCHSQTITFCGKNAKNKDRFSHMTEQLSIKKSFEEMIEFKNSIEEYVHYRKVERPTKEELAFLLWDIPTNKIANKYNVSDNTIRKWARQYQLTWPSKGYWQKEYSNRLNNASLAQ